MRLKMGNLEEWSKTPPFWEGVSSTFDLFGFGDLSLERIKRLNAIRLKRNTVAYDLSVVGRDMRSAINQYEEETKNYK
jgi:hypothetical protein